MRQSVLAAALLISVVTLASARQGQKPAGDEEPGHAAAGFDCPSGELNPDRPKVKLSLGDVTKKARVLPKPNYTREARGAGSSGVVPAEVVIDMHSGKVIWARVAGGRPYCGRL